MELEVKVPWPYSYDDGYQHAVGHPELLYGHFDRCKRRNRNVWEVNLRRDAAELWRPSQHR